MNGTRRERSRTGVVCAILIVLATAAFGVTAAHGQSVPLPEAPPIAATGGGSTPIVDPNVTPVSCSSCGGGLFGAGAPPGPAGCASGECGCNCVPGRTHCCSICEGNTCLERLCCGLYNCICCPDPCYEGRWIGVANAALFVDDARPVTHMRLRYDGLFDVRKFDRAEFLTAAQGGLGLGPKGLAHRADIQEFHMYNEIAAGGFGFFIDTPFRHIDFEAGPVGTPPPNASGFGDLSLGTKSLLLDCDLLQVAFQFTTFIPVGQAGKGTGTGHTSLEPALLMALKLTPDCYMQFESAYWIPIGGTAASQGNVWHNHLSFNKVVWYILPDVQLIGTLELVNWNMLNGAYTEADFLVGGKTVRARGRDFLLDAGPGLRLNICDRIDVGVGTLFSLNHHDWIGEAVRAEFRWRF